MTILLMATHFDGLHLPEGTEKYPHGHEWKVSANTTKLDKHGRPYCTKCKGMPIWYSLKEVESLPTGYLGTYMVVDRGPGIIFTCSMCGEQHLSDEMGENGVIKLPATITTSKNKNGEWFFHCTKHDIKKEKPPIPTDPTSGLGG